MAYWLRGDGYRKFDESNEYVYHYTSRTKMKQILNSGVLYPSTNEYNDCLFGVGVYFTSLKPSNNKC